MRTLLPIIIAMFMAACAGEGTTTSPDGEGMTGLTGPVGPAGEQGPKGDIGPTGPVGQSGPEGSTGLNGGTGEQGPQGLQGTAGAQGQQGAAGLSGATGPRGLTGAQGATGANGPQGIPGSTSALTIYDATGTPMGYPITIDYGDGKSDPAFYAHRETPPADFPEGFIVVPRRISYVAYEGSNCTGQTWADAREIGFTYPALYKNNLTEDWVLSTAGPSQTRSIRSHSIQGGCFNTSTVSTVVEVNPTTWNLTIRLPLQAAAL